MVCFTSVLSLAKGPGCITNKSKFSAWPPLFVLVPHGIRDYLAEGGSIKEETGKSLECKDERTCSGWYNERCESRKLPSNKGRGKY